MDTWLINSAELLFAAGLVINAFLFIPQALRLYKQKQSAEVSLVTFGGFWIIQLLTVIHAFIVRDWILFIGYILALMTCGSVILLTIYYHIKSKR